jgi:hypothetical protein
VKELMFSINFSILNGRSLAFGLMDKIDSKASGQPQKFANKIMKASICQKHMHQINPSFKVGF